jgi:FkbM family methyltransferase
MIEPSPERVAFLRDRYRHEPRFSVVQALAGSRESTVLFREQDSNSGVVSQSDAATIAMTETPLDVLIGGTAFAAPQFMKIDVQGYELEALKGATTTLTSVEVVVVELSLIRLHPIAPSHREAIDWLDDHGFRLLDIAGFIRRPVDSALWQIDGVFARKNSTLGAVARGW